MNLGAAQPCPEFVQALSVCLQEYLVRVRNQMTEWFTNILTREPEVATNSQGQPITSAPEDFFNIIHLQVLVALSKLSADNMCAVIVVCLNVIKTILEETLAGLKGRRTRAVKDDGASGLTLEMLCATVNDYDRLQVGLVAGGIRCFGFRLRVVLTRPGLRATLSILHPHRRRRSRSSGTSWSRWGS